MDYSGLQNQFAEILLTALRYRDAYTEEHSNRLALIAREVCVRLKLSSVETKKIILAAKLHDIGKIAVSDTILLKPSKLTEQEFDEIKKHPLIGYEMLKKIDIFSHIADYILQHHEKYDGSGYPNRLSGKNILQGARIIGVVDAVDAMATKRIYKERMSIENVLVELEKGSGSQFDPYICSIAMETIREYADVFTEN